MENRRDLLKLAWAPVDESKPPSYWRKIPVIVRGDLIETISVTSVSHDQETRNDDQPGCSSWITDVPPPTEFKDTGMDEKETSDVKENDPLETAWTDLVERVSVAGWSEAFDEKLFWIRACNRLALIILSIVCVYYVSVSIRTWARSGYNDQINDFAMNESLPFPNVTICAQVYFNQTFIQHNLTIPNRTMEILRHQNVSMDDFYRQLSLFLTPIARPHTFSPTYLTLFSKITAANPQVEDYSSFSTDAWLPCESMLRRCWFDGEEFDCCSKAVASFDEDGICFQLALNMDSDNALPDKRTVRQRTPGPNGGLEIDASVDTRDFPWLDDDAQNGFRVLVSPTPFTIVETPVAAPHGAITFIAVTPQKLVLAQDCAKRGQLTLPFKPEVGHYYDPEGFMCVYHRTQDISLKYAACQLAVYVFRPNRTIVCSPLAAFIGSSILAVDDMQQSIKSLLGTSVTDEKVIQRLTKLFEDTLHSVLNNKVTCPIHCERWTYSSTASFFYLENEKKTERDTGRMFSRLRIYYPNLDYRQHEEVKEITWYLAFCDFGNIVGLYWGMSIVSFFHVLYYVSRYLYVRRQHRRRIRDVAIAPVGS